MRGQAGQRFNYEQVVSIVYALAMLVAASLWFPAIRAALWLDETHSFFVIKAGFAEIMPRQGLHVHPVYPYILWLCTCVRIQIHRRAADTMLIR